MRWSITSKVNLGLGSALAVLIVIGGVSYQSTAKLTETERSVAHTHEVLEKLEDVLADLAIAETAQGGYLITGQESYLEPYYIEIKEIGDALEDLQQLTVDNPEQVRRLDILEPLVLARFAKLKETIEVRKNQGFESALQVVQAGQGKQIMDNIQKLVREMLSEERELLKQRKQQTEATARKTTLIVSSGSLLGLGFVSLASFIIKRDITKRQQVEEALQQAHNKLEVRVEERTAELRKANEHLRGQIFERQRAEEEVRLLQTITQAVSESQSFHSALDVALRQICEVTAWSYGEAWIPDPDDPHKHTPEGDCIPKLTCSPAWYASAAFQEHLKGEYLGLEKFRSLSEGLTFPPHIGLPGRVWSSKRSEWMQDVSTVSDTAFLRVQAAVEAGFKAGLGIPILTPSTQSEASEILAVLVFFMAESREEDKRLVEIVSTVAAQLGSLIQRKRAEEALHSSVATNRVLLNAIPDVMFRISKAGVFVNFKAAKDSDLPVPPDQLLGKNLAEVFPEEVAQPALDCVKQALQTGNVQILEFQLLSNHNLKDYEARIVVSAKTEVMAIVRDITERKRAEADIHNALEKEKELGELKSRFVTMASHEFRTPLSTILSSTELLEHYSHKWSEEKKLTHFQRIQVAVKQMTGLLNDVLLIGKAEAGKLEFEPTPLELAQFCRDLVEEMQISASSHSIAFCSQGQCQTAVMDENLLRQVLINLLSNAIKYSPQGGTVHFDLICNLAEATFHVRDDGIGIPEADQAQLFNSFHRASNVGTISGTGLGLAIVKKSLDLHGGNIAVKTEVGVGTTFIVTLPLNKQV